MLTYDEALAKARERVAEAALQLSGRELVVREDLVTERARGWTFPYNTKRFLETKNPLDGLVGNGPILVDKYNGSVHHTPSGGSIAWLEEYDRTGVPPAAPKGMRWVSAGPPAPLPKLPAQRS
jgi:hypothetical protein